MWTDVPDVARGHILTFGKIDGKQQWNSSEIVILQTTVIFLPPRVLNEGVGMCSLAV